MSLIRFFINFLYISLESLKMFLLMNSKDVERMSIIAELYIKYKLLFVHYDL